ncbi:unnamed protein product, partial [Musa textilis]
RGYTLKFLKFYGVKLSFGQKLVPFLFYLLRCGRRHPTGSGHYGRERRPCPRAQRPQVVCLWAALSLVGDRHPHRCHPCGC